MPRKKEKVEKKEYFIKGKQVITDPTAPVISNEFLDKQPDGDYTGQTIEVHSDTKLESDIGVGEPFIMRTYEFKTDPTLLHDVGMGKTKFPTSQEIFNSHARGIAGLLWGDGLSPATEIEPVVTFTTNRSKYLIMVWARPSIGQTLVDKTKTLTEIVHGNKEHSNKI